MSAVCSLIQLKTLESFFFNIISKSESEGISNLYESTQKFCSNSGARILNDNRLIKLLLKYLKKNNNNFTKEDFNRIAIDNNYRTRFFLVELSLIGFKWAASRN